jgi:hypothetical protein
MVVFFCGRPPGARDRGGLAIAFNHIPDPKTDK